MKRAWRSSMSMHAALGVLGTLGFLALWQAANAWGLVDPIAPAGSGGRVQGVGAELGGTDIRAERLCHSTCCYRLPHAAWADTRDGLPAFCLGILIGWSEWLSSRLNITLALLQYLPPAVVVPVVLLFFGKGNATVLVVIVFGAFWPVLLNTIDGVRGADPLLVEVARIYRLRQPEIAWKIVLPMALPQIVAGLRLAVSVSLLATVVGEMLGGTDGLGFLILIAQRTFEYPEMYSGIRHARIARDHSERSVSHAGEVHIALARLGAACGVVLTVCTFLL